MPTYGYFCNICKKETDIVKKITEYNREEVCECGEVLQRKIEVPAGQYKGSGFTKGASRDIQKEISEVINKEGF